jgi:hypothetical protein
MMKVMLQARGLWDAVEYGDADFREDRTALEAILCAVPAEMLGTLAVKETAKDAWDTVKTMRVGVERVRKSKAQTLLREYDAMEFSDCETVEEFSLRLSGLITSLATLGNTIEEPKVVEKLLNSVPEHLSQVAISIETLLDIDSISLEEVTGRLRNAEEKCAGKKKPAAESGKLMLTEEQWQARMKERRQNDGGSSSGGSKGTNHRRRGRGHKAEGGNSGAKEMNRDSARDTCRNYGKPGHWAKDCRKPKKTEEAHLVQGDEKEDGTLLLMRAGPMRLELDTPPLLHAAPTPVSASPPTPPWPLKAVEANFLAQVDGGEKHAGDLWYLDTRATNHMTGARDVFSELDTNVHGNVKFGDGSVMRIEGRSTVLVTCRSEEHKALTGVYFIPRLSNNIVSLDIRIRHGLLCIWDMDRRLLARVRRDASRLYTIQLEIARPMCLMTRGGEDAWWWHARYSHLHFQAQRRLAKGEMVSRWSRCVTTASQASNVARHFPRRHVSAPPTCSTWSTATFAARLHRRCQVGVSTSCSWLMIKVAICGCHFLARRIKRRPPSSASKLPLRWSPVGASSFCTPIAVENSPPSSSGSTAPSAASSGSSRPRIRLSKMGSWSVETRLS